MALIAILISAVLIVLLCLGDPKRRRAARLGGDGQTVLTRRSFAVAACLPGMGLALAGDAPAFLIWLGGCAIIGWSVALGFHRAA